LTFTDIFTDATL